MAKKKQSGLGPSIGGILVGFDQQIFRTTPPVNELVAKGTPLRAVAASGGGTVTVGMPDDLDGDGTITPADEELDKARASAASRVQTIVSILQFDLDAMCAGIQRVLDQFLDHGRRPLDDFAGGNLVDKGVRQLADRHG